MKRLLFALVGGVALLSSSMSASAQYYYDDPYGRPPPPRYRPGPPPDYYGRPPPDYYGGPRYRPRQRISDLCVTSRGVCGTRPAPSGTPCQCYIEGFGRKRGNIQ